MSDPRFTLVPFRGISDYITTQRVEVIEPVGVASTTAALTPLEIYMRVGSKNTLELVLESSPSVTEVVTMAMARPGILNHDRAVELLGRMSGQTLSLALRGIASSDYMMRPFYANKAWEMLASALSKADNDGYGDYVITYFRALINDSNPVKRLAAIDALDVLEA